MSLLKSGNPVLSEKRFKDTILDDIVDQSGSMSVKGTLNKFALLFLLTMSSAFYTWKEFAGGGDVWPMMLTGVFGGLGVAILFGFKKQWGKFLAPVYALLEGMFVGGVSAYYESGVAAAGGYSGIVFQAVALTFAVVAAMYLLYKFKIIQATKKFKAIVLTASAGIMIFYLVCWGLYAMNITIPSFVFGNSAIGIGFSVFVVALAALNLIIDFDMIEQGVENGAPKYMEWYGAFGLLVTIVWLYVELLRLLAKLRD